MKKTREQILRDELEKIKILEAWLKEFHGTSDYSTREFIGHINGWSHCKTLDGKFPAEYLWFEVYTGASYTHGDKRIFELRREVREVQDRFIGENDCGKYDIEKDHRDSRLVKITVDRYEFIRSIEWAVDEKTALDDNGRIA